MAYDLRAFVDWIVSDFEPSLRSTDAAGHYAREPGGADVCVYGVADMACVLYSIGRIDAGAAAAPIRRDWAAAFAALQDSESGLFVERGELTHDPVHASAYAVAAQRLLGVEPAYPLTFTHEYADAGGARRLLDALDWQWSVYPGSHIGTGIASIFANVDGLVSPEWFDDYFSALDARLDPTNGMHGDAKPAGGDLDQVGGSFHYMFMYEYFGREMPHASARIGAVSDLQQSDGYWARDLNPIWLTLDGVYLLTRSVPSAPEHRPTVDAAVRRSVHAVMADIVSEHGREAHFCGFMGAHALAGTVTLLAEAQRFLGTDEIISDVPLRVVLDARPFV